MAEESEEERRLREKIKKAGDSVQPKPGLGKIRAGVRWKGKHRKDGKKSGE